MNSQLPDSPYGMKVASAMAALKTRDFQQARTAIADAMTLNMDAPEPHNLLGILYEMLGDYQSARKHYRAGYALDPVYQPCCRNLERITDMDTASWLSPEVYDAADATVRHMDRRARTILAKR